MEPPAAPAPQPTVMFQSSLEENPEWNTIIPESGQFHQSFNPHSRKTPSGTYALQIFSADWASFNPHSRKTPSGTQALSLLMSGAGGFQSSLEENPEWNVRLMPHGF